MCKSLFGRFDDYADHLGLLFSEIAKYADSLIKELLKLTCTHGVYCFSDTLYSSKTEHLAEELMGRYRSDRPPVKAIVKLNSVASIIEEGRDKWLKVYFGRNLGDNIASDFDIHVTSSGMQIGDVFIELTKCDDTVLSTLCSFVIHLICECFEPNEGVRAKHLQAQLEEVAPFWDSVIQSRYSKSIDNVLLPTIRGSSYILAFGNGGSCTDAEEISRIKGKQVVNCLYPGYLTCVSNDWGYHEVMRRALEPWVRDPIVILGFSTSGNSDNIVRAYSYLYDLKESEKFFFIGGVHSFSEAGGKLGKIMKEHCNDERLLLCPETQYANRIQEAHVALINYVASRSYP